MTATQYPATPATQTPATGAPAAPTAGRPSLARRLLLVLAVVLSVVGFAGPASAATQTYHSTPVNGMWHSGNVTFSDAGRRVDASIHFNDRAGDAYCTQLRWRAHQSDGTSTLWIMGTVCGGRSAVVRPWVVAGAGTRLTLLEVWTVRADGGLRSYVWTFRP